MKITRKCACSLMILGIESLIFLNIIGAGSYNSGHWGDDDYVIRQWYKMGIVAIVWRLGLLVFFIKDRIVERRNTEIRSRN